MVQIIGTENNDILVDYAGDDIISALGGNDEIETTGGNDFIYGDSGTDKLIVNYFSQNENLEFVLINYNSYSGDGILEIYPEFDNYKYLNFSSIEQLELISGSGDDWIDLGFYNNLDAIIKAGTGNDSIFLGQGFNFVDGGIGFDLLYLDFSNSITGVDSSFDRSSDRGEYYSDNSLTEFTDIEAIGVNGSPYDDVLAAIAYNSNAFNTTSFPIPLVDGREGYDELVIDYSDRHDDYGVYLSNITYNYYNNYASVSGVLDFDSYNNPASVNNVDFSNIEAFNITMGRGNDNIDLGYENQSDDTIRAGAGNDFIFSGMGQDLVDGGSGIDLLSLNFVNSFSGVTSSINNGQGEYSSNDSAVEFSNIEAVDVFGSTYDDVLVALPAKNAFDPAMFPMPTNINGNDGYDQLVIDYSDRTGDGEIRLNNSYSYSYYNNYPSVSGSLDYTSFNNPANNSTINFNDIEAFNIKGSRGNDNIDLGYDNQSDDTIRAGAGNDFIFSGMGQDLVDGGSGIDLLSLNFVNSFSGVTSSINNGQGEYSSNDSAVEFSNIEAVDVFGSTYDDVLVGFTVNTSVTGLPIPIVDGNDGYDELVLDYSDRYNDHDLIVNFSGIENYNYATGQTETLQFNNIEGLNITTGRGNNWINLGYDNLSDDTVKTGAGNDTIFTGQGYDVVDGGAGFDVLNLDFSNSTHGITSSLSHNSGSYFSENGAIEYSNIEAINIIGSTYDDVLIAATNNINSAYIPVNSTIDGGDGFDKLVIDYSYVSDEFQISLDADTDTSGRINIFYPETNNTTVINFNNIETISMMSSEYAEGVDFL